MKLQQLQVLVAVVEQGSIRAAARHLSLSQAALTKSMRLLEEEVNTPLLVRRSRGVDLTEAGERLLARARLITRQVALAQEDLRQADGEDCGSVRVGITPYLTLTALGGAFNRFRQRYQNVEVQLIEGLMARVLPRLRDGTLDFAVVASDFGELQNDHYNRVCIYQARQRIVVREGHPVLKKPSAQALAALEWVHTQPMSGDQQGRMAAMFALAGVPMPSRVVLCETLAGLTLIRNSDVASLVPEPLLGHPESRGLVVVEGTQLHPCDMELLLLTRPDVPLTPAATYFAHCLAEVSRRTKPLPE